MIASHEEGRAGFSRMVLPLNILFLIYTRLMYSLKKVVSLYVFITLFLSGPKLP